MRRSFGDLISGNARGNAELSSEARAGIIAKHEAGVSNKDLAAEFRCNPRTIYNTLKRWKLHNTTKSKDRPGRPDVLTRREKRNIIRIVRKAPKLEYSQVLKEANLNTTDPTITTRKAPPSKRTIARALSIAGLRKRKCAKRPKLTAIHALMRKRFAWQYRNFNWETTCVKFTDECSVQRGTGADAEWCFRYPGEKYNPKMITEKEKSNKMSQMVWGAIWVTPNGRVGRSPLIIMERDFASKKHGYSGRSYTNTLEEGLLPQYRPGQIFMQDNAPIHTSKHTKEWLETHGIWTMEWPPFSPDLNPIEHMWWALKRMVHKLYPELATMGYSEADWTKLQEALKEAWLALPNSLIRRLVSSMEKRLAACRKAKGWQTKY
jgi:transposase